MTLSVQYLTMGMMMASGIAMGVIFDVYRVLTGQLRLVRRLVPLLDLVYWAGVTIFVFRMLKLGNEGQLRFFVFIGLALGTYLYYWLFSGATRSVFEKMIKAVKWLARMIYKFLILCVVGPAIWLYKLAFILLCYAASVAIFLLKIVLQLFYPVRILLVFVWKQTGGRISWAIWTTRVKQIRFFKLIVQIKVKLVQWLHHFRK
ncbi:MAG: spore cortex biosynthesis protein YabQ [Gorillibacterium sp.]|nr:spore cortex biosynthesis protein YabQ [Gorillibacterium sp.]